MADVDPGAKRDYPKSDKIKTRLNRRYVEVLLLDQADRCRLLDDFHHSIVQGLIGMRQTLHRLLKNGVPDGALAPLSGQLDAVIRSAHRLADEIAPHVLLKMGLEASLRDLLEKYACGRGFTYMISCDPGIELIGGSTRLVTYLLLKRLLRGMIGDCRADLIRINIRMGGAGIEILIEDNGLEFDLASIISSGRCGIRSFLWESAGMVRLLGGRAWAGDSRGISTTCLILPLHPDQDQF